ncbi:hypothetical protein FQN55_002006 [Onygenales sp. PD_40]|nr:hypothetical protein FQN55_002006 [Onygenales sp. PD_40]
MALCSVCLPREGDDVEHAREESFILASDFADTSILRTMLSDLEAHGWDKDTKSGGSLGLCKDTLLSFRTVHHGRDAIFRTSRTFMDFKDFRVRSMEQVESILAHQRTPGVAASMVSLLPHNIEGYIDRKLESSFIPDRQEAEPIQSG